MLRDALNELLMRMTGGLDQPPTPRSILVAELRQDHVDERGRPIVRTADLRSPEEYEARFVEILGYGLAWINVQYCGAIGERGLVAIEFRAAESARSPGRAASVNFSGPPTRVAEAGWDALAYVVLAP